MKMTDERFREFMDDLSALCLSYDVVITGTVERSVAVSSEGEREWYTFDKVSGTEVRV